MSTAVQQYKSTFASLSLAQQAIYEVPTKAAKGGPFESVNLEIMKCTTFLHVEPSSKQERI